MRICFFLAFTMLCSLASALADAAAESSTSHVGLSAMKYFSGSWSCNPKAPNLAKADKSRRVTDAMEPNGKWFTEVGERSHSKYTYNSESKKFWYIYYDDSGNFNVLSSPGWIGHTLVWKMALRDPNDAGADATVTFTKLSAAQYDRVFVLTDHGKAMRFDDICSKA